MVRMPSYTTRVMISYVLLALIAAILSASGVYHIKNSLSISQAKFHISNELSDDALDLHDALESRRRAERLYYQNGQKQFIDAWVQADKRFSSILSDIRRGRNTQVIQRALARISSANVQVQKNWQRATSIEPEKVVRFEQELNSIQYAEDLEPLLADLIKLQNLQIKEDQRVALDNANATLNVNIWLSILVIFFSIGMALYVNWTLRKPLSHLLEATQKISKGQLDHRIDFIRQDELGALTTAFDDMSFELHRKDKQIKSQFDQLKKSKALLESYSQDLEIKNKEIESFIYTVSHDLKTPLIAIQGFLSMFAKEFSASTSEKAQFYLERVRANSQNMQALIQQLLELSLVGEGNDKLTMVSTGQIAQEVIDDLKVQIESRHADVKLVGDWPEVVAEPSRIKQALTNLVDNALHYNVSDKDVKIEIGVEETDRVWRFYVHDNGLGIDEVYQKKIFGMFERLSESYQANKNGTGMGLAIVKKIAESHGGNVGVKSKPGQGSTFFFEILKNLEAKKVTAAEVQG